MIRTAIGYTLICFGLAFDFFGALGLLRLPDVFNRLQAATKCVTFGSAGILVGVFVLEGFSAGGIKALICMVFILLTSPVAAHAISRAAYRSGVKPYEGTVVDMYGEKLKESENNDDTKN